MEDWPFSADSSSTSVFHFIHVMSLSSSQFAIFSTQKILHNARLAEQGVIPRDPLKESVGLELDVINILYVSPASFNYDYSSLAS
jgi:hypothetical protein